MLKGEFYVLGFIIKTGNDTSCLSLPVILKNLFNDFYQLGINLFFVIC